MHINQLHTKLQQSSLAIKSINIHIYIKYLIDLGQKYAKFKLVEESLILFEVLIFALWTFYLFVNLLFHLFGNMYNIFVYIYIYIYIIVSCKMYDKSFD